MVAVHVPWGYSEARAKQWLLDLGVTFSAIHDDPPEPIGSSYGVQAVPHVFIIDPDMKISAIFNGLSDCEKIKSAIEKVIPDRHPLKFMDTDRYTFGPVDIPRWMKVAYLIINMASKDIFKSIEVRPSERFNIMVKKHLEAYLQRGKMPPKEISSAILNLADEYAAGKVMNLRAGDYIALQTYMRKIAKR